MRRFLAILVHSPAGQPGHRRLRLVEAGCLASPTASATTNANAAVTVTGAFGKTPVVTIPKLKASNKLTVKTVIHGTGAAADQDGLHGRELRPVLLGRDRSTLKANTFTPEPDDDRRHHAARPGDRADRPEGRQPCAGRDPARRRLRDDSGNSQLGITGTDTLVFVIDLIKAYANTASASGTQESNGGGILPTVSAHAGQRPDDHDPVQDAAVRPW